MGKKIGILTFFGVPNYGAFAQAYALNRVISKLCPFDDVLHINYLHSAHWNMYYKRDERLYQSFWYSYNKIPHTEQMNAVQLESSHFDTIITGSDAIWEFSIAEFGNDEHLIGNRLNCNKLFAYAPSFGTMGPEEKYDSFVKKGLERYGDHISVRDTNSAKIVKKLTKKDVPVVLDPVMLWDFSQDPNIERTGYKNYIVVYGVNFSEKTIQTVSDYAKKHHLRTISIGYTNPWCDINIRMLELRCLEWIGMFENASAVCTSTFHGLQFALIYGKRIYFEVVPYVSKRSEFLLKQLGIFDLFSEPYSMERIMDWSWNYTDIYHKLVPLRNTSLDFLKSELY